MSRLSEGIINRLEKEIEKDFCNKLKCGIPLKLTTRHWPDRLVLLPEGRIAFIEFKRPGENLKPGQIKVSEILASMGFEYFVAYSSEKALNFIDRIIKNAI